MKTQTNRIVPLVLTVTALAVSSTLIPQTKAASWTMTGSLNVPRTEYAAALLPNGTVLVAGGYGGSPGLVILVSSELYNPASGTWSETSDLNIYRMRHTATRLNCGQVLVASGQTAGVYTNTATAEIYDPDTGTWTFTGALNKARNSHTATLLPNGNVLVVAGYDWATSTFLSSAELYNPTTGTWTLTGALHAGRNGHTATLLSSGRVLVAGGWNETGPLTSAEVYDPGTGTWTITGALNNARLDHSATLLPNNKVVVAGGTIGGTTYLASAELYNESTGTWTTTGSLNSVRGKHTATLLPNGMVVVVAGWRGYTLPVLGSAEVYNPAAGTWLPTASLNQPRTSHTTTLLPNGKLLAASGSGDSDLLFSAELFTTGLPDNDVCGGAVALTENVYYAQNTVTATDDGDSTCLGRTRTKGVWFTYTPSLTGTATVDTCPSDFDTMIEIFGFGCSVLTSLACNDDSPSCGNSLRSSASFECTAGTTYHIWAGGYNGASGNLQIRGSVVPGAVLSCSGTPGGDYYNHGFYVPSYRGTTLNTAQLLLSARTAGNYVLTLTVRSSTYDGPILATASQTVTLNGSLSENQPVIFTFPPTTTVLFSRLCFILSLVSGPGTDVYYAVPTSGGCTEIIQTEGTTPPLDSFRRNGVNLVLTGTSIPPETLLNCSCQAGGDGYERGFYVPQFPGVTLTSTRLELSSDYTGTYVVMLTVRSNSYDGPLLGLSAVAVALNGCPSENQPVTFTFPSTPIAKDSRVCFILALISGPSPNLYYTVPGFTGGCTAVVQTYGTTPPLDTFRRYGVNLILEGVEDLGSDLLRLTIARQPAGLYLYWNSTGGRTYTLQTGGNVQSLSPFQTGIPATPPTNTFGPIIPIPTQQFYRLMLEPLPVP